MEDCLLSTHKVLSSTLSRKRKKEKKGRGRGLDGLLLFLQCIWKKKRHRYR